MLPVVRAVVELGGSASTRHLYDEVWAMVDPEGRWEGVAYDSGELKLINRISLAMMYCKRGGLLDSPRRALYLITDEGVRVAGLSDADAKVPIDEAYRAAERTFAPNKRAQTPDSATGLAKAVTELQGVVRDVIGRAHLDEAARAEILKRVEQLEYATVTEAQAERIKEKLTGDLADMMADRLRGEDDS